MYREHPPETRWLQVVTTIFLMLLTANLIVLDVVAVGTFLSANMD